jgi:hypothetical protein
MQRLISACAALAFALALGGAVSADPMATPAAMSTGKAMMMSTAKPMTKSTAKPPMSMSKAVTKCPSGQTLVKGYTKKDGTKVAAYCRKGSM